MTHLTISDPAPASASFAAQQNPSTAAPTNIFVAAAAQKLGDSHLNLNPVS